MIVSNTLCNWESSTKIRQTLEERKMEKQQSSWCSLCAFSPPVTWFNRWWSWQGARLLSPLSRLDRGESRGWERPVLAAVIGDPDVREAVAVRLVEWLKVALDASTPELLHTPEVDHVAAQARRHGPHVHERDDGELASPADGQRNSTDGWQQLVAAALAAVETLVGAVPHTLDGVSAIWFTQDLVKADLEWEM